MRLAAFAGDWVIRRDIEDLRAGETGALAGTARFTPAPGGLAYLEEGALTLANRPPVAASRSYFWRQGGAGVIEVLFADGRLFHSFDAEDTAPAAVHDCPPDRYRVRYDFRSWPRWTAEWRVRGPRKDYAMVTRFQPADERV